MAKHKPSSIWPLFRDMLSYVATVDRSRIAILMDTHDLVQIHGNGKGATILIVNRRTARMLARRIDQCLEATK